MQSFPDNIHPSIAGRNGANEPMKRRVCLAVLVSSGVLAMLASMPGTARAQDTEWNRYTLEDLGGVFVRVVADEACEAGGVTASTYEADVSLELIEAEVGVLTQAEMLEHPALPELRISLTCAPGSGSNGMDGAMAYSVELRLQQAAQMLRDTQITLPEAVTWYATAIGVTSSEAVADAVGAALLEKIDEFAVAWAEAHAEEGERS